MTKTLFIKGASTEALTHALKPLLTDEDKALDHAGILGPPPPVRVSPQVDGWVAINGLADWIADLLDAAKLLSTQSESTLSCELLGNSLRLRFAQYVRGEERHLLRSPHELTWNTLTEHQGAMPRYDDVEDKAYKTLRALGVPNVLLGIDLTPLGDKTLRSLGEGLTLGSSDSKNDDDNKNEAQSLLKQDTIDVQAVSLSRDEPPTLPREESQDFGISLFDDRYVEGRPSAATVERLLDLEAQWEARARRACGEPEVNLTITYHGGTYQEQLDKLLRVRGHYVPPTLRPTTPPWWAFWKYFGASAFRKH